MTDAQGWLTKGNDGKRSQVHHVTNAPAFPHHANAPPVRQTVPWPEVSYRDQRRVALKEGSKGMQKRGLFEEILV
jgi:hypothetical protein